MRTRKERPMGTCSRTQLSPSYSYKLGCRCEVCNEWKRKAVTKDSRAAERSRRWRLANPERSRENSKRYQRENPEYLLKWQVRRYGLSLEEFRELEEQSDGKCMCCGSGAKGMSNGKRLHIDHDHDTGKVRGLLCGSCNVGLGLFKHNQETLMNAIRYLKENGDVGV